MDRGRSCLEAIEQCPKPVICAVDGYCLGGGFEILLACDLVFATNRASFGFPEAKLGIIPGFGGTQRATCRLGAARAKEMAMTGRRIDADTALSWGLINRVVAPNELLRAIREVAASIADISPNALKSAKYSINTGIYDGRAAGMAAERENSSNASKIRSQKRTWLLSVNAQVKSNNFCITAGYITTDNMNS